MNCSSVGLDTALRGPAHARELEESTDDVRKVALEVSEKRSKGRYIDRNKTKSATCDVTNDHTRKKIKRRLTATLTTTDADAQDTTADECTTIPTNLTDIENSETSEITE